MNFFQCTSLSQAQSFVCDSLMAIPVANETIHLLSALDRILAEDVLAVEDLPPFRRSTVDGFAVRSVDTFGASETAPALLTIIGEVLMGQATPLRLLPGQAALIPTGGMLPQDADAVVMVEHTELPDTQNLLILKNAAPGENVINKGEDLECGTIILKAGQRLASQQIGALAACGIARIKVNCKIKVAVISTGDELVDIDRPAGYGQIRDVNSYALSAMLIEAGCLVEPMGIIRDDYKQFLACLQRAVLTSQVVLISGGSSVGTRDYTIQAIQALEKPGVVFHGLAVKPGKPTIFGMAQAVPVFGLPGHPVAAMTMCEQLVKPAVRILSGQKDLHEKLHIRARLTRNIASAPGRDDFVNMKLSRADGEYQATPILGKSGLIRLMVEADGVLHIPKDKSGLYEGEWIDILGIANKI